MTVRVLSIDGGGIRGILPARVLVELEAITGKPVAELFDLIAGTASGAVLALGLAAPGDGGRPRFRAKELLRFYIQSGRQLFPEPEATLRLRQLAGIPKARHSAARALDEHFGETTLGDALVDLIVPTFDLTAAVPLMLRSEDFGPGVGPAMRDVALASSSLPTHSPSVRVELSARSWSLTHGGIAANNPAPFAYAAALGRAEAAEVVIVSLGTGTSSTERPDGLPRHDRKRWPIGAARSFDLHLEASSEAQHQLLHSLVAARGQAERYWRMQPSFAEPLDGGGLSEAEAVSDLAERFVAIERPVLESFSEVLA